MSGSPVCILASGVSPLAALPEWSRGRSPCPCVPPIPYGSFSACSPAGTEPGPAACRPIAESSLAGPSRGSPARAEPGLPPASPARTAVSLGNAHETAQEGPPGSSPGARSVSRAGWVSPGSPSLRQSPRFPPHPLWAAGVPPLGSPPGSGEGPRPLRKPRRAFPYSAAPRPEGPRPMLSSAGPVLSSAGAEGSPAGSAAVASPRRALGESPRPCGGGGCRRAGSALYSRL